MTCVLRIDTSLHASIQLACSCWKRDHGILAGYRSCLRDLKVCHRRLSNAGERLAPKHRGKLVLLARLLIPAQICFGPVLNVIAAGLVFGSNDPQHGAVGTHLLHAGIWVSARQEEPCLTYRPPLVLKFWLRRWQAYCDGWAPGDTCGVSVCLLASRSKPAPASDSSVLAGMP